MVNCSQFYYIGKFLIANTSVIAELNEQFINAFKTSLKISGFFWVYDNIEL